MAKGDDAVRRKKNKVNRKRLRNSESSVSARIAAIIASKRRRKSGKRRISEGMCFSLPTLEDPFNDRHDNKNLACLSLNKDKDKKQKQKQKPPLPQQKKSKPNTTSQVQPPSNKRNENLGEEDRSLSKFLILCLDTILNSWEEQEEEEASLDRRRRQLLGSSWGAKMWRGCYKGWNVVDTSGGGCATNEQLAWLLSTASDIIARKEKQGLVLASPFLLFLVPSQERAIQVRSVCKPLKALGVHTVSLHPGASKEHQIHGLKSCEPEFLISTPERLLELVHLQAIDISGVSLLVLDGLKSLVDFGFSDKVKSIKESISGEPQMVVFSNCYEETSKILVRSLLKGPVCRLTLDDSVSNQSAFISQHVHVYTSENDKLSKTLQILTQAFPDQELPQHQKVLLVAKSASKAQMLASKLKDECYAISEDSLVDGPNMANGETIKAVSVKDIDSMQGTDVAQFEIVIFPEFPSIENYVDILTKIVRRSITGAVHCFFSTEDAPLAQPLIKVLEQCGQAVPESLRDFETSTFDQGT